MRLFERYVVLNYLKHVLVIFVGLDLFYVSVDLLTNYKSIPDSANLQLLYALFQAMNAINYVLPLSLVFGMIVTYFGMIKSNELISLYASGVSKRAFIRPLFGVSLVLTLVYISLNMTEFAYAYEYGSNLKRYHRISNSSEDLFLKHDQNYIHFEKLEPLKQHATGVSIFETHGLELVRIIKAKRARFIQTHWLLEEVEIVHKPLAKGLSAEGLRHEMLPQMEAMQGFKPRIMDTIVQSKHTLSILDSIDALHFLQTQGMHSDKIKAGLFYQLFFPFFAPFLVVLLFYRAPWMGRYTNTALVASAFSFVALMVWSGLFILSRLCANGVLLSEVGILIPILLLGLFALSHYVKSI